MRNLSAD